MPVSASCEFMPCRPLQADDLRVQTHILLLMLGSWESAGKQQDRSAFCNLPRYAGMYVLSRVWTD